jgi:hypothetical protein
MKYGSLQSFAGSFSLEQIDFSSKVEYNWTKRKSTGRKMGHSYMRKRHFPFVEERKAR